MRRAICVLALAVFTSLTCLAQATAAEKKSSPASEVAQKRYYELNFVVRELENGRVINTRSYSIIYSNERGSLRAGEKVPFNSGAPGSTQWQQLDVGVNIDSRSLEEMGDRVSLCITADISSILSNGDENRAPVPVLRNNRWDSRVLVPIRQPTVVFSSDDPASKRKMQLQLTVTPVR